MILRFDLKKEQKKTINKQKSIKSGSSYEKSAKLIRFAQSRGFELDVILKVIKQL